MAGIGIAPMLLGHEEREGDTIDNPAEFRGLVRGTTVDLESTEFLFAEMLR
jgi:hypothetical protein